MKKNLPKYLLEHFALALKELVRILKPGGILVISDMDEHNFGFLETEHNDRWMGFKIDCVGEICWMRPS